MFLSINRAWGLLKLPLLLLALAMAAQVQGCASHVVAVAAPAQELVSDWYRVRELEPGFFRVDEADHVTFFVLKEGDRALFIDSGMGLDDAMASALLKRLGVSKFDVLNTHAHCDHVGLNYRADRVWIDKTEWKKYQRQGEIHQMANYHAIYQTEAWPIQLQGTPEQKPWTPTDFISNSPIVFGKWKFKPVRLAGHTKGSRVFIDEASGKIFSGDLIYDGALYLHLADSSLADFERSLAQLQILVGQHKGAVLYPGHNTVPLPVSYIAQVQGVIRRVANGSLPPKSFRPADKAFVDSDFYEADGVKLYLKR